MFIAGVAGMVGVSDVAQQATSDAEQAGAAIGAALGMGMLLFLWFIPMVCALVLGLFMKKASVIEKGPTGELAETTEG